MESSSHSEWVLFAEAAKGPCGTASGHFFETRTPSTELSGLCNTLAWNNHPWADIITSAAEAATFWSDLKGHAHFPTHASSCKSEGLSVHLFVAHPDAEAAEDTSVIFHGESNSEKSHAGGDVLGHFYIGSAGYEEFGRHFSCAHDSWKFGLNHHSFSDLMGA